MNEFVKIVIGCVLVWFFFNLAPQYKPTPVDHCSGLMSCQVR